MLFGDTAACTDGRAALPQASVEGHVSTAPSHTPFTTFVPAFGLAAEVSAGSAFSRGCQKHPSPVGIVSVSEANHVHDKLPANIDAELVIVGSGVAWGLTANGRLSGLNWDAEPSSSGNAKKLDIYARALRERLLAVANLKQRPLVFFHGAVHPTIDAIHHIRFSKSVTVPLFLVCGSV